jgi:hypothetical protein
MTCCEEFWEYVVPVGIRTTQKKKAIYIKIFIRIIVCQEKDIENIIKIVMCHEKEAFSESTKLWKTFASCEPTL